MTIRLFETAAVILLLLAAVQAAENNPEEATPKVTFDIASVDYDPSDTLIMVPVYVSSSVQLAGIELYLRLEPKRYLYFATDELRPDGMVKAVDTAGTLLSGWEWISVRAPENDYYDLKLVGLADWPGGEKTAPMDTVTHGLLMNLLLRQEPGLKSGLEKNTIMMDHFESSLSDPVGNSIGVQIVSKIDCRQRVGDSCLAADTTRTGFLDTTIVRSVPGIVSCTKE